MYIFLSLYLLIMTLCFLYIQKEMKCPLAVFSIVWFVIIFLYSIKLFDINEIQENTSLVIFIGTTAFIGGYLLQTKIKVSGRFEYPSDMQFKRLTVLSIIVVLTSLTFYIPNILQVLRGSTTEMIKIALVTGEIDGGGAWMQFFVRPFKFIIIATAAYCIVVKRSEILIIISGILLPIFDFLGSGSKTSIVYLGICIVITYFMNANHFYSIKKHKKMLIGIVGTIIVFVFIKVGISKLYYYICGCIPLLDQVINNDFYLNDGFTYGFLSFNSVVRLVINILGVLGLEIHSDLFERANIYISHFEYTTKIANNVNYNAMHTMYGDFYADLGVIGVLFFSFFFGMFSCYIYRKYKKSKSLYNHIVYCILMYYIVFSMVRFHMSNTYLGLMMVYSLTILKLLFFNKKRINFKIFRGNYLKI